MTDRSSLALRLGTPLFRLNWCLLAVWLLLATFGRISIDALYYGAVALHVLVAFLEPLLERVQEPVVRWASLALAASLLVASIVVGGNAMNDAAARDVEPTYYEEEGTLAPDCEEGEVCEPEAPEA